MNLLSKRVRHAFFGEGTITKISDKKIYVQFEDEQIFPYPMSFLNGSLTLLPLEQNSMLLKELNHFSPTISSYFKPQSIHATTNAEFLNTLLGKKLKGYMRSVYKLTDDILIWMVYINEVIHYDWRNSWDSPKIIYEEYLGNPASIDLHVQQKFRIVAEKIDGRYGREYRIHGLYKINEKTDGSSVHIWELVEF